MDKLNLCRYCGKTPEIEEKFTGKLISGIPQIYYRVVCNNVNCGIFRPMTPWFEDKQKVIEV